MRRLEAESGPKPYTAPALTMHGDVREVTQAVNGSGNADNKAFGGSNGNAAKVFRTG